MEITKAIKETIWLRGLVNELYSLPKENTVHYDSQSALHMTKDPLHHERSKYINACYHFVKYIMAQGETIMHKINCEDNLVDMLTKTLPTKKFKKCFDIIGAQGYSPFEAMLTKRKVETC